jgi:hypothetical protein
LEDEMIDADSELRETVRIVSVSMADMVYGPAPRRTRYRLPTRAIFLAAFLGTSVGCATAPRPVEVETVGQLSASATHVVSQPVHATTDFAPAAAVADTGDDVPTGETSLDILHREAAQAGAVDVAAKTDGVTIGGAR